VLVNYQGSLGRIHVSRFVSFPTPTKSFGDVGRGWALNDLVQAVGLKAA
jgi:hypothetical protein